MLIQSHNEEIAYCKLSVDEEYLMAKWVMDVLCLLWIDTKPEFQKLLRRLFNKKSFIQNYDFNSKDMEELFIFVERYSDLIPLFPNLKDDGKCITSIAETKEERILYVQKIKRIAWYETWKEHKDIKVRGDIPIFPDTKPSKEHIQAVEQQIRDFNDEVRVRQDEYDCSLQEAVQAVSDYKKNPIDQLE